MASATGKSTPLDSLRPVGGGNSVVVQDADPSDLITIQETLDSVATDADYAAQAHASAEYSAPPPPHPTSDEEYAQHHHQQQQHYGTVHMQMRPIPVVQMYASEPPPQAPLEDDEAMPLGSPASAGAYTAAGTIVSTLSNLRATRLALLVGIVFLVLHHLPCDMFAGSLVPALAAHPAVLLLARPGVAAAVILVLANTVACLCD